MEKYDFLYKEERIPIEYRTDKNKALKLFNYIHDNKININNSYLYSLASWVGINFKNYKINEEFSEIENIEILEPEETYDLEIKDGHSYTANGIICHNTHNLPQNISIEEVNKIYFHAWKVGCKGCTIYREGSRQGVLITEKNKEENDFIPTHAPKRPKELKADYFVATASGVKYAVIVGLYKDKPYEIFAFENPPLDKNTDGKVIKVKKGHYKFINHDFEIDNIQLAANRVEQRAHTILLSMLLRHRAPIEHVVNVSKKIDDNITSFSSACRRVLSRYVPKSMEEKCPNCNGNLIREEGCVHCDSCEYSKC